jgi:hypothetical protein
VAQQPPVAVVIWGPSVSKFRFFAFFFKIAKDSFAVIFWSKK